MLKKHFSKLLLVLFATVSLGANAATFNVAGGVTAATGALAGLTPIGTPVAGPIVVDDTAVAAGLAGAGDILGANVSVGGFCFSSDVVPLCGGSVVPITAFDAASLTFAGGMPTGGLLDVRAVSPTFGFTLIINFDFDAGTFFAADTGGAFGTVSGDIAFAPVPVPAAVWFMGSALLGLIGMRRRA